MIIVCLASHSTGGTEGCEGHSHGDRVDPRCNADGGALAPLALCDAGDSPPWCDHPKSRSGHGVETARRGAFEIISKIISKIIS